MGNTRILACAERADYELRLLLRVVGMPSPCLYSYVCATYIRLYVLQYVLQATPLG